MTAHAPERTARLSDTLFVACGLAWGAGLLHAVVAVDGMPLFAIAAVALAGWGTALYRTPSRALLACGAILGLALAAREIASPAGGLESIATADEVALAMLALIQLRARRSGWIVRGSVTVVAMYLILLTSMSLMPGPTERAVRGSLVAVPRAGFEFLCHPG